MVILRAKSEPNKGEVIGSNYGSEAHESGKGANYGSQAPLLSHAYIHHLAPLPGSPISLSCREGLHRVDPASLPLSPTLRKVILDERDAVQ